MFCCTAFTTGRRISGACCPSCRTEPGFAVRAALERGELSADLLLSYEKLRTENAYSENAESYLAAKEEKFKKIAMLNKINRRK